MRTISMPFQAEYLANISLPSVQRIIWIALIACGLAAVAYSFLVNAVAGNRLYAASLMKEVAREETEVARNQTLMLANSDSQIAAGDGHGIMMEDIGSNLEYLRTAPLLVEARRPGTQ